MQTLRKAEPTGWAILAGTLLLLAGAFNAVYGITALLNSHVLVVSGGGTVSIWDITTWGWITLLLGAALMVTAFGLFAAQGWARWIAIVVAALSAIAQISIITENPWWSLAVITLDVLVIYELAAHWQSAPA
jgi:hypothetical protein